MIKQVILKLHKSACTTNTLQGELGEPGENAGGRHGEAEKPQVERHQGRIQQWGGGAQAPPTHTESVQITVEPL